LLKHSVAAPYLADGDVIIVTWFEEMMKQVLPMSRSYNNT